MDTKNLLSSRTFWLAIVQGIAVVLAAIYSVDPAVASIGWLAIVKSVVDVALRMITATPVTGIVKK